MCALTLQKGAYSKDMLFVEQLLNGLVASHAIRDVLALSQASGMFPKVHKHLLRAGGLEPDVQLSLHMSTLAGLNPLQVFDFHRMYDTWIMHVSYHAYDRSASTLTCNFDMFSCKCLTVYTLLYMLCAASIHVSHMCLTQTGLTCDSESSVS